VGWISARATQASRGLAGIDLLPHQAFTLREAGTDRPLAHNCPETPRRKQKGRQTRKTADALPGGDMTRRVSAPATVVTG
jgi:hypothetical protein